MDSSPNNSLRPDEFAAFSHYLQSICGISLSDKKKYLVETRIRRILNDHEFSNLQELVNALNRPLNKSLRNEVVEAMTTNETYWFRDSYPFELLRKTLFPKLSETQGHTPVRIWSAACSSGQEAYSISMCAAESHRQGLSRAPINLEVVGTDVSSRVLEAAQRAEYDQLSVGRGLPAEMLARYFDQSGANLWRVKPEVRKGISFRYLNLIDSFSGLGRFDVIFCRNVLIYFDAELKQEILRRLHSALKPNGILFLGASEGIATAGDRFEMVLANPGIYYKAI